MGQAVAHDGGERLLGGMFLLQLKLLSLDGGLRLSRDKRVAALRLGPRLYPHRRYFRELERQIEQRLWSSGFQLKLDLRDRHDGAVDCPEFP